MGSRPQLEQLRKKFETLAFKNRASPTFKVIWLLCHYCTPALSPRLASRTTSVKFGFPGNIVHTVATIAKAAKHITSRSRNRKWLRAIMGGSVEYLIGKLRADTIAPVSEYRSTGGLDFFRRRVWQHQTLGLPEITSGRAKKSGHVTWRMTLGMEIAPAKPEALLCPYNSLNIRKRIGAIVISSDPCVIDGRDAKKSGYSPSIKFHESSHFEGLRSKTTSNGIHLRCKRYRRSGADRSVEFSYNTTQK